MYQKIFGIFFLQEDNTFLKHILKFSGYETIESVLKLRQKEDLEKAFSFVKAVSEIVENKEEMFGIFYKNPDELNMLIPGHEVHLMEYTLSIITSEVTNGPFCIYILVSRLLFESLCECNKKVKK
jgi:hypothetical protein